MSCFTFHWGTQWSNRLGKNCGSLRHNGYRIYRCLSTHFCAPAVDCDQKLERHDTNHQCCVPIQRRVAIALWIHAANSEYRGISHLFGLRITMVCPCVHIFCASVEKVVMAEVINLPNSEKLKVNG